MKQAVQSKPRRVKKTGVPTTVPADSTHRTIQKTNHTSTPAEPLYSEHFYPDELENFEYLRAGDLIAEISMLRVAIRRVFSTAGAPFGTAGGTPDLNKNPDPSSNWMEVLDKLGLACSRLAGLLRTQQALSENRSDEVSAALSQALAEITKELKLE